LYLVGSGIIKICDRLPHNLPDICPACGMGIKPHRGFQWISPLQFFHQHLPLCEDEPTCIMCNPPNEQHGLMWVGNRFYSASSFAMEATKIGVSKRIAHVPRGIELGKTIVYLAHRQGGIKEIEEKTAFGIIKKSQSCPAIFYVFRPIRIEKLIWKRNATTENILELEKQGITPIIVPDNDIDHDPDTTMAKDVINAKKPKHRKLQEVF